MRRSTVMLGVLACGFGVAAQREARSQITQNLLTISLKSGETVEVNDLWFAVNCKSQLKSPPVAEVLEGPAEVTVSVKEAMVFPRKQNCDRPVKGGKLLFTAKEIEDYSTSKITVRITYNTKDGERKFSESFNISLFPKQD